MTMDSINAATNLARENIESKTRGIEANLAESADTSGAAALMQAKDIAKQQTVDNFVSSVNAGVSKMFWTKTFEVLSAGKDLARAH